MATKGVLSLNTTVDDTLDGTYPAYNSLTSLEYLAVGGGGGGGSAAGAGGGGGGFVTGNLPVTVAPFSYSAYLNGSSYLKTAAYDATFTGDFTFECWAYITAYGSNTGFFTVGSETGGRVYFALQSGGQLWSNVYGGADYTWGTSTTVQLNIWTHIAWVRVGSTVTVYINGISIGTQTISGTFGNSGGVTIGANPAGGYLWTGYLSNLRLVNSALYTANFVPPKNALTAVANTKLLTLGTSFDDSSTNNVAITKFGNPIISPRSPFESPIIVNVGVGGTGSVATATLGGNGGNTFVNSGWSGYFNGSTDYLSALASSQFNLINDFTIECWIYKTTTADAGIFGIGTTDPDSNIVRTVTSKLQFWLGGSNSGGSGSGTKTGQITCSTTLSTNTWYHIALVRSGTATNNVKLYLNGIIDGQGTATYQTGAGALVIGRTYPGLSEGYFPGYISNFRLVNGTALYTANVVAPTQPLIAIPNTNLLTLQNSNFIDNSSNTRIITKNGNAYTTVSTSPFEAKVLGGGGGASNQNAPAQNGWASGGGDAGTGGAANRGAFGIYGQGNQGGTRISSGLYGSGGGGGAGGAGGQGNATNGGNGGNGLYATISGSNVAYAGGGGGQTYNSYYGSGYGGAGGGGDANIAVGGYGGMYLGGGGGGGGASDAGANYGGYGGTGVVILRHPVAYDIVGRSANAIHVSYSSGYKIYTLRANDTVYFNQRPTDIATPNVASVSCLVIGGGGGGGSTIGGGGGAGGFVAYEDYLIMRGNTVTVTVGAGGLSDNASGAANAFVGANSTFGDIISYGGGGGASWANNSGYTGASSGGSSGGDGGYNVTATNIAGQGSRGGFGGGPRVGGGGGGAGQYGFSGSTGQQKWSGNGGNGLISSITGTPTYYCGGGAGGVENSYTTHVSTGGLGGGGDMGYSSPGVFGAANTGGGGGAGSNPSGANNYGGSGGSGVVIISYSANKYGLATSTTGSPTITLVNGNYVYKWTSSGSITF